MKTTGIAMNQIRVIALLVAVAVGASLWRSARSPLTDAPPAKGSPAPTNGSSGAANPVSAADEPAIQPPVTPAAKPRRQPPPHPTHLPSGNPPYHGVAIQVHSAYDAIPKYGQMIREIAALGADTVMFSVNGYQKHVESTTINTDPDKTPTDEEWLELFDLAHNQGLRIVLMPKILLSDPRGNNWRGKIQPTSWDQWFSQYKRFVVRFARLAEQGCVEAFIVGSELISTEKFTDQWRDVIAAVRRDYSGRLSYSANWDHYRGIRFWDDLDLIGMTTYHKLSDDPKPSLQTLRESWGKIRRRILAWQRDVGKPILFTEAGWCSQEGCSVEAWNYYRQEKATPDGLKEQRDCYQAFVETWDDLPAVGGIIWWEWTAQAGGPKDFSYTPKSKPAESVLRCWFQQVKARHEAADSASPNPPVPSG